LEEKEMANFTEQLQNIGEGKEPTASSLTFLSDLSSEDKATFRELWPEVPVERRRRIVGLLATMGEDNIELYFRPIFLVLLGDSDSRVRLGAIEGLVEDESKLLMSKLIGVLHDDPEASVREAAAIALGRFTFSAQCNKLGDDAQRLRGALLRSARTEQTDVRRRAIESLGYLNGDSEVHELIVQAYQRGGRDAESAVFAMGRTLDERWAQTILDELESEQPAMRYEAARAAGEMTMADALPFLVRMIDDTDSEVRLAAVWALGQVGGRPAGEALARALKSKEPALREAAQEAINELAFSANPLSII
jgi:HEAT repeat protein